MRPCDFRCPDCKAEVVATKPDALDQSYGTVKATRFFMEPCPKCVELVQADAPVPEPAEVAS